MVLPAENGTMARMDRAAGHVERQEDPVAHPGHARQAGDQDAERGGEAPEEHRPAAALSQIVLATLDALRFQDAAEGPGLQQAVTVLAAHQVADRVADDGPGDPGDQDRPQVDLRVAVPVDLGVEDVVEQALVPRVEQLPDEADQGEGQHDGEVEGSLVEPAPSHLAVQDHGEIRDSLEEDVEGARQLLKDLEAAGIDYDDVVATLEKEGVQKFADSFKELFADIESKRDQLVAA